MISVLNQTSSLIAEDALSSTETNLQGALQELSTGLRINSGANDPAGLSIADGLGANIAALNQSSTNAANGVGLLQTASGALSQVATLLNQAVTIATEASNGGLTTAQADAANTEFQSILTNINEIGSTTNFNGTAVFGTSTTTGALGGTATSSGFTEVAGTSTTGSTATSSATGLNDSTALETGEKIAITDGTGNTLTFTAAAGSTVGDLVNAINDTATGHAYTGGGTVSVTGTIPSTLSASINGSGNLVIADSADSSAVSATDTPGTGGGSNVVSIFTSDGTSSGSINTTVTISALSSTTLGLNTASLSSTTGAQSALTAITAAINAVSSQEGSIGASVNQLTADESVQSTEVQNLTSAQDGVQDADVGQTVSNMTEYNVLQQTGMAALSQAQNAEQNVLKLIQNLP
ncbi:MAG: flagellin [Acidobacteriaceae bacterium]